jgi:hypothetical protein
MSLNNASVLHITNHVGTIANLKNVFALLGKSHFPSHNSGKCAENLRSANSDSPLQILSTIKCPLRLHISEEYANILWKSYSEIARDFDTVVITDTVMYARAFLQNMSKHRLNIVIYVTNRFDWGFFDTHEYDRLAYTKLLSEASRNPRVRFCADNRYDQYLCSLNNIQFYYGDIIRLTPPLRAPVLPIHQKAFVYDRGTPLYSYINSMPDNRIEYDVFGGGHPRFRDMAHIAEYRCIFHLPYQTNVQALWENLGYCNIYLIPSKRFIKELIATENWYYWEEKTKGGELLQKSIELAEWYQPELAQCFVYFDTWEDIHSKFYDTDFMEKKRALYEYMQKNNRTQNRRWIHLFESFTI